MTKGERERLEKFYADCDYRIEKLYYRNKNDTAYTDASILTNEILIEINKSLRAIEEKIAYVGDRI